VRTGIVASVLFLLVGVLAPVAARSEAQRGRESSAFRLTSRDVTSTFAPAQIFNGFGCSGGNVSPQLSWSGAPAATKSFALTVFDPDAPTGSGWWHWVVVNIPASTTELPGGASGHGTMPAGAVETRTDFGQSGYGGPCPPAGARAHRYVFTLYALKVDRLDLDAQASGALASFTIRQNSLATASFTATYGR